MAFEIAWSDNAVEDLEAIVNYLQVKWSIPIADNFVANLGNRLETLSHFPHSGIFSEKDRTVRYIVITKHNKLFYRTKGNTIHILDIFDTRQNPSKNSYE